MSTTKKAILVVILIPIVIGIFAGSSDEASSPDTTTTTIQKTTTTTAQEPTTTRPEVDAPATEVSELEDESPNEVSAAVDTWITEETSCEALERSLEYDLDDLEKQAADPSYGMTVEQVERKTERAGLLASRMDELGCERLLTGAGGQSSGEHPLDAATEDLADDLVRDYAAREWGAVLDAETSCDKLADFYMISILVLASDLNAKEEDPTHEGLSDLEVAATTIGSALTIERLEELGCEVPDLG